MIEKSTIEQYLKVNGVSLDSPEEEIKSILFSAKWHEDDVETALMVLKENINTHVQKVDSLHKVFHTDERLQPETISALLGIDVDITHTKNDRKSVASGGLGWSETFTVAAIALTLASVVAVGAMWHLKIGVF